MINPPKNEYVEKWYNNIAKSPNDKRLYRGLLLVNKMKVLLISDPEADVSAACMDVNVGYMNDPDELPGLAHFCEHMLCLGTEKYPSENEYVAYLSQHGGIHNAYTSGDRTSYYFNVACDKFEGALDRFAQFFTAPLFSQTMTDLELNAIHSEYMNYLADDSWRHKRLNQSSADPAHPFSKFDSGNKKTLNILPKQKGINVREELLEFYRKYYSANLMALSVLAKESLDDLEKITVELFSKVQNREVELPVWSSEPFKEEHFQNRLYIVPVMDIRNLNIIFPMPDLREYYRSWPTKYTSYLLAHEGKGSLLSVLKARGWCNKLIPRVEEVARGIYFFKVFVDLTEEGIERVDDIITLMYQYINMLKAEGPVEWIYNEYKDIADMNFRFQEELSPISHVFDTAKTLQIYPIGEVLTVGRLVSEWRPDLVNWIMEYLTPHNIRVHVIAKMYKDTANEREEWYGIEYKKERISQETIDRWAKAGLDTDLKLPAKNEFIPTQFDIKLRETDADNEFPIIVEDTPFIRLWYKQDNVFLVPKANLMFLFVSPLASIDPISYNCCNIFAMLLRDSLKEYAYPAYLAGLNWHISSNSIGIGLTISGYEDKQLVLLEKIMDSMVNFIIDPKRFTVLKDNIIRNLKNQKAEQPYRQASFYLAVLLLEEGWVVNELLEACSQLTVERVQQYIIQFFSRVHVEGLIHGNTTLTEAIEMARLIETKLTSATPLGMVPLLPKQLMLHRNVRLEDGSQFWFEIENEYHSNSCTHVYYQTGLQSTQSTMLLQLLLHIISEPCYNTLRTKEQLGYIVSSKVERMYHVEGLSIIVQSDKHPKYVERRIAVFIDTMLQYISTMSKEEFNSHKESLAAIRLQKHKLLNTLTDTFWKEILSQQYNFDRANIEVAYLRTITKEQIVRFYKQTVSSEVRHKLSVHVIPTARDVDTFERRKNELDAEFEIFDPTSFEETAKKIEDVTSFKTSQHLYPLVKPFKDIPRKGARSSKL